MPSPADSIQAWWTRDGADILKRFADGCAMCEEHGICRSRKNVLLDCSQMARMVDELKAKAVEEAVKAACDKANDFSVAAVALRDAAFTYQDCHRRLTGHHLDTGRAWDLLARAIKYFDVIRAK